MSKKRIALIGGGPSCLIAAYFLADHFQVSIYEAGKSIGRKFLVAGNGGFNLTNVLNGEALQAVYSTDSLLHNALSAFDSTETQNWLNELGIETYVGSSGRVFPLKGIKPAEVLAKIKGKLGEKGVEIHVNSTFSGFNDNQKPIIKQGKVAFLLPDDHVIFGLGGGSWSKTGANSKWLKYFNEIGVKTTPFEASNCGVNCDFTVSFLADFEGTPLKNIGLSIGSHYTKGEALLTNYGLEGNLIYPVIPFIREQLAKANEAIIYLDFKPNNTLESVQKKTENGSLKIKNYRFVFKLDPLIIQLLKLEMSKEDYLSPNRVAEKLKAFPVRIQSLRPIEEAISTVGGIAISELNSNFTLRKYPQFSIVGEMLDWDAPTGGFLLQGCFSTGFFAAKQLIEKL